MSDGEDRRLRELAELAIIEAPLDPLLDQLCRVAGSVFGVPIAYVSLIDETLQHYVASIGLDIGRTAREDAICDLTIRADEPLLIEDAGTDPRVAHNRYVTGAPNIRFYAGVPLALTPGVRLGTFCILDTVPRCLRPDQLETLRALADLAVGQVRHHANRLELTRRTIEVADKQTAFLRTVADLEWIATHDDLTQLLNRGAVTKEMNKAFEGANSPRNGVALIIVDIDRFKLVNDTMGHDAGDAILVAVARRLTAAVASHGLVARIGGDEFAVFVEGLESEGTIAALATDILLHMREPVIFSGIAFDARVTLGVALHSMTTTSTMDLFKEADIALYSAKQAGRDAFAFYQPFMREDLETRVSQLALARAAVVAGRFEPYYQPKICLATNRVIGFEALLRWHHPSDGLSGPEAMGDVFLDAELAVAIGRGMLYRASADMVDWRQRKLEFGHVALNAAEPEFYAGDYAERVRTSLAMHSLTPDMLEIEVTESVFLGERSGVVARTLKRLYDDGVSIALDDFGTGFASLTHLRQYPVGSIKIDRSFIADVESNAHGATIVGALISMANTLEIGIVAEGIETEGQLAFLRAQGCRVGQGYLFAKPMPASRVPHFLRSWTATHDQAKRQALSGAR